MSVLVDTNVLLRRTQASHPLHTVAVNSITQLLGSGEPVHYTLQNVAEFWNVATRPSTQNGLGFPAATELAEVDKIETALEFLPDNAAMYVEWKRLVVSLGVSGVKVHDARLVAAMNVDGVRQLLTFNAGDFVRYSIDVLDPSAVAV